MEVKLWGSRSGHQYVETPVTGEVIGRDARAVYNGGLYSSDQFDLTPENVDKVLEDVLPYLIADSGNVDAECLSRTTPFLSSFKILSYVIYLSSSFFNFLFWSAKL
nr:nifU-like protein 1, chloroplastic [Ipomoea batatas]